MDEKREKIISRLTLAMKVLAFAVIAAFFVSPLAELIHRIIGDSMNDQMYFALDMKNDLNENDYFFYQALIGYITDFSRLAAKIIFGLGIVYSVLNWQKVVSELKKYVKVLLPLVIFALFSVSIYVLSLMRGISNLDLVGDYQYGESMFHFMSYPFVYFTSGLLISKLRYKKILIYIFMAVSVPINLLEICDIYFYPIRFYIGTRNAAIFHHCNHYGYYLVMIVVASALMFVYEKSRAAKAFCFFTFILANACMMLADALGALLSIMVVLAMFAIYCFIFERARSKSVIVVLIAFVAVAAFCTLLDSKAFDSLVEMGGDIGDIATDPKNAGHAGTGRWYLWTTVAKYTLQSPLYGWGIDTLRGPEFLYMPHNDILLYASYFGIPVAVFYLAAVGTVFLRSAGYLKKEAYVSRVFLFVAVGYFVNLMVGVSMYNITPMYFCFLGLAYSEYVYNHLSEKSKTDDNTAQMNEAKSESVQSDIKKESL